MDEGMTVNRIRQLLTMRRCWRRFVRWGIAIIITLQIILIVFTGIAVRNDAQSMRDREELRRFAEENRRLILELESAQTLQRRMLDARCKFQTQFYFGLKDKLSAEVQKELESLWSAAQYDHCAKQPN